MADVEISDPFGDLIQPALDSIEEKIKATDIYDGPTMQIYNYTADPIESEQFELTPTCPPAKWGNMKRKHHKKK